MPVALLLAGDALGSAVGGVIFAGFVLVLLVAVLPGGCFRRRQ